MFTFKSKDYGTNNRKVVFLLAGWSMTMWQMWLFSKILAWNGYFCITYAYDLQLLSPNVEETLDNCRKVKKDILQRLRQLQEAGYNSFCVFGTSFGSLLALMIANSSSAVSKIVLNLAGADLAEIVWSWDTVVKGFKSDLQRQNITLPELKSSWKMLNAIYNSTNLQGKKILLYRSQGDELIPYEQGLKLIEYYKERKYHFKVITIRWLNHMLAFFFNLLRFKVYLDFLNS